MEPHPSLLLPSDQQAIVALCTPRGSGAIGLIRLSGGNALAIASSFACISGGMHLPQAATHTIHHGFVIDPVSKERIDEVLFLVMLAPRTFTGQDTVEITCHNNPFIIERIINIAVAAGARTAQAGEFTRRAFLHNKLDLVQAEALNDLIHAQTEQALKQSMAQLRGTLSQALHGVEDQLVALLSYVEASFEFLDEEQRDIDFDQAVKDRIAQLGKTIQNLKQHFALQKQVKQGVRIALVGSVNAGKSTLFNALLGQDRAIVTPVPGTTRDSIEATLYRAGSFWLLIDTAGIRQTDDIVEQQGIERSLLEAQAADVVLIVVDAARPMSQHEQDVYNQLIQLAGDKGLLVFNKVDALSSASQTGLFGEHEPHFNISAATGLGLEEVQKAVEARVQAIFAQAKSPYLLNQRQFNLLSEIEIELEGIAKSFVGGVHYELLAYRVKDLIERVSALTGKNVTEHMLDKVFSEFCVGK